MRLLTVGLLVLFFSGCGTQSIERRSTPSGGDQGARSSDQGGQPGTDPQSQGKGNGKNDPQDRQGGDEGLDRSMAPSVAWDGLSTLGNSTFNLKAVE